MNSLIKKYGGKTTIDEKKTTYGNSLVKKYGNTSKFADSGKSDPNFKSAYDLGNTIPKAIKPILKPIKVKPPIKTSKPFDWRNIFKSNTHPKTTSTLGHRNVVQQGKVPVQGLERPDNPFAPAVVNFANTTSLGLLEANNDNMQQLHEKSPVASTIGSMAGYMMPFSAGSKLARPITNKIAKPLLKRVAEGAMVGSGVELASGIVGQRGVEQTAKNVGYGAALGGVADVGLYGAGKLLKASAKNYKGLLYGNLPKVEAPKSNILNPKGLKAKFNKPVMDVPKVETPQMKINNANGKLKPQITQMKSDSLPLKNRTLENVGNRKVNAYTYDNPSLHSYVADEANIIKGEIARGSKPVNYGANTVNGDTIGYGGVKAVRSETTAELSKATGGTYKEIDKALDDIIHDKGKENYALAKKVELAIDDRLSNGYREDVLGHDIPAHSEYLQEKAFIDGMPQEMNTSTVKKPLINSKLKPLKEVASTIEPPIKTETSQFKTNTLRNSEFLGDKETQSMVDNIAAQYEVKPNAKIINKAAKELTDNYDGVVSRIRNTEKINGTGALNSAEDSAASAMITRKLTQEAKLSGDYTEVKAWLEILQPKVTNTAQSLQAMNTWKNLSPEGTIFKAQQVVGETNRAGVKAYGKNFTPVELTTGDIKKIADGMEDVIKMPENTPAQIKAKERAFAKVKKVIGDKIPATLADKIKGLQRISLLLNPKTNVRNVLGNTILNTLENTKDIISAPLDKLVSLKTGKQTTLFPSLKGLKTQGKGMVKGFKTVIGDAKAGVNTSQSKGQFEISGDKIFNNKILNGLDKATNTALRFGDEPFYQGAFDESIRQQLKISKLTEPTKDMLAKAKLFAEDRTLQNTSAMSIGFKKLQKGLNEMTSGSEDIGLGTFAVPFVKTPANILDKAIDYTPIGSLKAISQLISKKTFNQKLFVDRIGRSVAGTGAIALGYDLAKDGKITGSYNKDKDVSAFDRQTGKSPYSFKSGDTYRTFDWAAPGSIMLAIGADMYYGGKDNKDVATVAVEALKSGGSTLFKQSLLQGFQRLFGYNDLVGGLSSTLMNVPTQFVPTALKQTAQLKNNTQRDTYDSSPIKKLGNQLKAKVPGLSETLPPKIDTLGREVKQFQGKNNAFNVLLNPSFTTKDKSNETEKFVTELYKATGSKTHYPRVAKDSITYKKDAANNATIKLTPTEKVELQKYIGQKTDIKFQAIYKNYAKSSNGNTISSISAKKLVKELASLLSDIYTDGENEILKSRNIREYIKPKLK